MATPTGSDGFWPPSPFRNSVSAPSRFMPKSFARLLLLIGFVVAIATSAGVGIYAAIDVFKYDGILAALGIGVASFVIGIIVSCLFLGGAFALCAMLIEIIFDIEI
jgi:hypothetical protein